MNKYKVVYYNFFTHTNDHVYVYANSFGEAKAKFLELGIENSKVKEIIKCQV